MANGMEKGVMPVSGNYNKPTQPVRAMDGQKGRKRERSEAWLFVPPRIFYNRD